MVHLVRHRRTYAAAAASRYFCTLFEGAFAESRAPVIQLKDCDAVMAGRLVAYIYTGKVELAGVEDAAAVLEQAQFYQIDTLIQDCADFLAPRVGASDSLLVGAVALGPLCTTLAATARSTTARDFDLASKTDMFLAGGVDTVKALLDDEDVHAGGSEDTVLEAVLSWVGHDAAARKQHLCALLDGVRLADISRKCFATAARDPCVTRDLAASQKLMLGFSSKDADTDADTTEVKEKKVSVYRCSDCPKITFKKEDYCIQKQHRLERVQVKQRWFTCQECSHRTYTLGLKMPATACKRCGGAYKRGSMAHTQRDAGSAHPAKRARKT